MKKSKSIIGLFILFICLLSLTIYTSFSSSIDTQEIIIKSMTPVYDETSGVVVDQNNVTFNDKNQVVKYNVVLENTQDYDVKISDIKLSTPTEEFLSYKVEDIKKDDVLSANSTKELVVSFETMRIDGWGRNFEDELTANISFEKYVKQVEEKPPVEETQPEAPVTNIEEIVKEAEKIEIESITNNTIEFKDGFKVEDASKVETWIYPETEFYGYKEVDESKVIKEIVLEKERLDELEITPGEHKIVISTEKKEVLGYVDIYIDEDKEISKEKPQDPTNKEESNTTTKPSTGSNNTKDEENKVENPYTSDKKLVGILGLATCITGVAVLVASKNKFAKYTVFILMLSPALTITNAEKVIEVTISNNVSFKSQNVMDVAYEWQKECWEECDSECECTEPSGYWEDGVWQEDCLTEECYDDCWEECEEELLFKHFWEYSEEIKNIYIQNEIKELDNYKYKYDVSEGQTERVTAYIVENSKEVCYEAEDENEDGEIYTYTRCYDDKWFDLYLQADGIIYPNSDASYYFAMSELESINNIAGLDTSNVTNMSYMFSGSNLSELDLSNFNTSNVTNMSYMFNESKLSTLDLSNFNTSKVTDMSYMFSKTSYLNLLDISNFDTSKVTDMSYMFYRTYSNTLNLSSFNTSQVTNMSHMFEESKLTESLDVSNFDTSKVTNMSYMFSDINSLKLLDVSSFNTSKVTNMSYMFNNLNVLSTLDVSSFDTSNVYDMRYMFYKTGYNSKDFTLDVSNFDTSEVDDMRYMFYYTGFNSTKLNTSFTIRKEYQYNSYYKDIFHGIAIQSGTQLTVNYTSEASSTIDSIINTSKSVCLEYDEESAECISYKTGNVVKGVQVD